MTGASEPLYFHSKDPATAWLSNFFRAPFSLDGQTWPSVEHYYQAAKYTEPALRAQIHGAADALSARKLGQDRSRTTRPDWETAKSEIMLSALRAKFGQNRAPRQRLLETGSRDLIHLSSGDTVWGRTAAGDGENRLGTLLMQVRAELRASATR